jgi:FAD/FMN-containing dehydrogenase/Fe-S oxidoreductase
MNPESLTGFRKALRKQMRGEVIDDYLSCGIYATDASIYQVTPAAIALPLDEDDVRTAVAVAVEHGIPITPRGGGTSLGGQAVGPGLVLDFTKHLDGMLELNVAERWVRVQPGLVRDNLNAALAAHGVYFAPDPATTNRAAIGGMIGNNSSGMRSLIYGKTVDHLLAARLLLADGAILDFGECSPEEYARAATGDARQARIMREFRSIVEAEREEIEQRFPKVMRRVSGYNLDEFIHVDNWNLAKLVVGSEGTLGTLLEAKLNLEPLPSRTGLCLAHFDDLGEALRAVEPILRHAPSAVEILDGTVLGLARRHRSIAALCDFIEGDPAAILIVEFFGESDAEIEKRQQAMIEDLRGRGLVGNFVLRNDQAGQARVWAVRKNGLGLMLGMKGERKPLAFIEDCCLPTEALPEYIERILAACHERQVETILYAHAGAGVIHVRPVLNLRRPEDREQMKAIAEASFAMVREYGGAFSGEHGDGRVRSPFIERFYGKRIYAAFRKIKQLFDPQGLMNPGIIIDPAPMDEHLRADAEAQPLEVSTEYKYRDLGGFDEAVALCNGVGACRQTLIGSMCPSFRATRDEEHSTRGRANALRLATTGQLGAEGLTDRRVYEALELCLSCKACKSECPSNVDLARLKGEVLQQRHDRLGAPLRDRLVAAQPTMAALFSGALAPFVNWLQGLGVFRKGLEKLAGFDSRRALPDYASQPFTRWFEQRQSPAPGEGRRKVVLFDDTFMNYHEPGVGVAAVELLESCGYEVVPARAGCCQRPRLSRGFLRDARRDGEKTLRNLDRFIQQGLTVVVCEPGCASALVDDLPDLIDDEQLGRRIKENVMMIDDFLARELREGRLDCAFTSPFEKILLHSHCHQQALFTTNAMREILTGIKGLEVEVIDAGCCGMAGSFGYEKEHYELSLKVGEDRLFPAIRNRPEGARVIACGFSCRHQIEHATGVKALHWVEVLRGA